MIDPEFPQLVVITCIPYMYHSCVTGKFITSKSCYAIRLDTNYYFNLRDYFIEVNEISSFIRAKESELKLCRE